MEAKTDTGTVPHKAKTKTDSGDSPRSTLQVQSKDDKAVRADEDTKEPPMAAAFAQPLTEARTSPRDRRRQTASATKTRSHSVVSPKKKGKKRSQSSQRQSRAKDKAKDSKPKATSKSRGRKRKRRAASLTPDLIEAHKIHERTAMTKQEWREYLVSIGKMPPAPTKPVVLPTREELRARLHRIPELMGAEATDTAEDGGTGESQSTLSDTSYPKNTEAIVEYMGDGVLIGNAIGDNEDDVKMHSQGAEGASQQLLGAVLSGDQSQMRSAAMDEGIKDNAEISEEIDKKADVSQKLALSGLKPGPPPPKGSTPPHLALARDQKHGRYGGDLLPTKRGAISAHKGHIKAKYRRTLNMSETSSTKEDEAGDSTKQGDSKQGKAKGKDKEDSGDDDSGRDDALPMQPIKVTPIPAAGEPRKDPPKIKQEKADGTIVDSEGRVCRRAPPPPRTPKPASEGASAKARTNANAKYGRVVIDLTTSDDDDDDKGDGDEVAGSKQTSATPSPTTAASARTPEHPPKAPKPSLAAKPKPPRSRLMPFDDKKGTRAWDPLDPKNNNVCPPVRAVRGNPPEYQYDHLTKVSLLEAGKLIPQLKHHGALRHPQFYRSLGILPDGKCTHACCRNICKYDRSGFHKVSPPPPYESLKESARFLTGVRVKKLQLALETHTSKFSEWRFQESMEAENKVIDERLTAWRRTERKAKAAKEAAKEKADREAVHEAKVAAQRQQRNRRQLEHEARDGAAVGARVKAKQQSEASRRKPKGSKVWQPKKAQTPTSIPPLENETAEVDVSGAEDDNDAKEHTTDLKTKGNDNVDSEADESSEVGDDSDGNGDFVTDTRKAAAERMAEAIADEDDHSCHVYEEDVARRDEVRRPYTAEMVEQREYAERQNAATRERLGVSSSKAGAPVKGATDNPYADDSQEAAVERKSQRSEDSPAAACSSSSRTKPTEQRQRRGPSISAGPPNRGAPDASRPKLEPKIEEAARKAQSEAVKLLRESQSLRTFLLPESAQKIVVIFDFDTRQHRSPTAAMQLIARLTSTTPHGRGVKAENTEAQLRQDIADRAVAGQWADVVLDHAYKLNPALDGGNTGFAFTVTTDMLKGSGQRAMQKLQQWCGEKLYTSGMKCSSPKLRLGIVDASILHAETHRRKRTTAVRKAKAGIAIHGTTREDRRKSSVEGAFEWTKTRPGAAVFDHVNRLMLVECETAEAAAKLAADPAFCLETAARRLKCTIATEAQMEWINTQIAELEWVCLNCLGIGVDHKWLNCPLKGRCWRCGRVGHNKMDCTYAASCWYCDGIHPTGSKECLVVSFDKAEAMQQRPPRSRAHSKRSHF